MHFRALGPISSRLAPALLGAAVALSFVLPAPAQEAPAKSDVEVLTVMPEEVSPSLLQKKYDDLPPAVVPELPEELRVRVDKELDWYRKVEDAAPIRSQDQNPDEYQAYNHLLGFAATQDERLLDKYAMRDVPFRNLIADIRQDYYLELLHFEGRIHKLSTMKPTAMLANSGIKVVYEGWLFPGATYNPVCILFTELPPGFEPNKPIDRPVAFNGYLFKLMYYEADERVGDDKYRWRKAPLVMGKTITPLPEPESISNDFVGVVAGGVAVLIVAGGLIVWWFSRTDRRMKAALADQQAAKNPFTESNVESSPPVE